MDPKSAEERFFKSLNLWTQPGQARSKERPLDPSTDVEKTVEQAFEKLLMLGRQSIPPR